ncbi:MAG TPA: hypothetical protein VNC84_06570 [Gammaproteobacteria bacterium]|jgi:hypothetical protein|nr:hypothetical protein [Gammaproteobacteria bacterium]
MARPADPQSPDMEEFTRIKTSLIAAAGSQESILRIIRLITHEFDDKENQLRIKDYFKLYDAIEALQKKAAEKLELEDALYHTLNKEVDALHRLIREITDYGNRKRNFFRLFESLEDREENTNQDNQNITALKDLLNKIQLPENSKESIIFCAYATDMLSILNGEDNPQRSRQSSHFNTVYDNIETLAETDTIPGAPSGNMQTILILLTVMSALFIISLALPFIPFGATVVAAAHIPLIAASVASAFHTPLISTAVVLAGVAAGTGIGAFATAACGFFTKKEGTSKDISAFANKASQINRQ